MILALYLLAVAGLALAIGHRSPIARVVGWSTACGAVMVAAVLP